MLEALCGNSTEAERVKAGDEVEDSCSSSSVRD